MATTKLSEAEVRKRIQTLGLEVRKPEASEEPHQQQFLPPALDESAAHEIKENLNKYALCAPGACADLYEFLGLQRYEASG